MRNHGQGTDRYDNVRIGMTGRLDTIQAAVLIEKLKIFSDEIVARERIARRYNAALADVVRVPHLLERTHLRLGAVHDPRARAGGATRWRRRSARRASRPRSIIRCRRTGRAPIADYPVAEGGLAVTEKLAGEVISLPMHAYLDEPTQDRIVGAVRGALRLSGLSSLREGGAPASDESVRPS